MESIVAMEWEIGWGLSQKNSIWNPWNGGWNPPIPYGIHMEDTGECKDLPFSQGRVSGHCSRFPRKLPLEYCDTELKDRTYQGRIQLRLGLVEALFIIPPHKIQYMCFPCVCQSIRLLLCEMGFGL